MSRSLVFFVLVIGVGGSVAVTRDTFAQGNPPGTVTVSSSVTGVHQFSSDLDQGGDLQWSSMTVSGGVTRQFVPAFAAGLTLRYGVEDWRIHSAAAFGGEAPWQRLQRPGASLSLSLALSRSLVVGVSPTVEWAYDSRANTDDAAIYGAVFSVAKVFSPKLVLGGGASVTRQFYNVKTSAFVIVNWKLTDRLRIANALPAGPEGGAGVELRYAPTTDWELAVGGVSRSDRWRLEASGPGRGNVGETSFIPMFARVSRKLGSKLKVDLYSGLLANDRIKLKDADGRELAQDSYRTAPAVALTLSGKF